VLVHEIKWDQVIHAGTVIFGPSFALAAHAGGWRGELKTAYRRRVLETHPDRAAVLGRAEAELMREFRAVSEAYELLAQLRAGPLPSIRPPPPPGPPPPVPRASAPSAHRAPHRTEAAPPRPPPAAPRRTAGAASARPAGPSPAAPPPPSAPRAASSGAGRARVGPPWAGARLPRRRLKLAEFLYYSGRVSWQDFVAAIAWQRGQRPAVGRIAVNFGFLDRWEVAEILERRRVEGAGTEPFGEFAVRRGYLSPFQVLALLGQQLRLQQPIGQYFVDRGLVDDADLDLARTVIFRHNARHGP
jgi:hypothetical protein